MLLQPGKYNDFMLWSYVNTVLWKELYLKQFGDRRGGRA